MSFAISHAVITPWLSRRPRWPRQVQYVSLSLYVIASVYRANFRQWKYDLTKIYKNTVNDKAKS